MGVFSAAKDHFLGKYRRKGDPRVADSDDVSVSASTAPDNNLAGSSTSTSTPDLPSSSSIYNHSTPTDAPLMETINNQGTQNDLWSESFVMFQERDTDQELLTAYTNYLASLQGQGTSASIDFSNPESVEGVVRTLLADREQKQWKFHIRNHNISVREQFEKLGRLLLWSDSLAQSAVSTQPLAALAWSGVSLILPLIMSSATEKEDMANGLENIGELQMFWQIFETEYLETDRRQQYENLIHPLVKLYSYVIEYQARVIFHLTSPQHSRAWQDVQRSNAWTDMIERISKCDESCRNLLQITTKSKIQDNQDQILQEIRESRATQEKTLQHLEESQKDHREQELLHALAKAANNYEENMRRNPLRVRGTCEWILENEEFSQWCESSSGVLWVSAGPGRGKSVFSRSLIDEKHLDINTITITSANVLTSPPSVVAHFFFKEGAGGDMDGAQALCAILWQIFWSPSTLESTTLIKHALPRYKAKGDSLVTNFPELWRILVACAADPDVGEIICVMDALDECEKESAHQIIETLHDFYSSDQALWGSKLKFLITSRPLQNLQDRFDGLSTTENYLQLDGESKSEQIRHEIDLVIDEKVGSITKGFTESDRGKIKNRLKGMQSRTYLWLHLIFKIIHNDRMAYSRFSDLEILLNDVPTEVSQVYERMLNRSKNKSRLKTLLELVLASRRPLTLDEANVAFTLAVQDQEEQAFRSHEDLMAARWPSDQFQGYIMDLCGLLISVNERKLSFIHQTAREFLTTTSKQEKKEGLWKGASSSLHSHGTISRQCMQYLKLPDVNNTTEEDWSLNDDNKPDDIRDQKYPFLAYSAKYWALHFINQEASLADQYTKDACNLCDVTKPHFKTWAPMYNKVLFQDISGLTILLVASYFGIPQVVQGLLDESAEVNIQDHWFLTALQAASLSGSKQVVLMLLDNDTDINAQFGLYNTALQAASTQGHQNIAEILLNRGGRRVNIQGGDDNTALQAASARGHQQIVEMLLCQGANVNIQGGHHNTALQAASNDGHQHIVEMLLNQGADINIQGGHHNTALQAASTRGHRNLVEILLNQGADVDSQGGYENTALQAASARGHQQIVEMLLNHRANVNIQGGYYHTALQAASAKGHQKIVEILLDQGADVDSQGGHYNTALEAASARGHQQIVEILE
ncbi:hypothetical protein N7494_008160 [Penicillium frequentans]|uniref:NWD NACHT-NTPase N-terminal domain-containing protein n=1 Tax=Penicillium frequentans TaxID=3151616 RepID=A0AAD6CTW4_9EURO|nr:hypothetical protein N7494_008160 [Penicillium glabrum]